MCEWGTTTDLLVPIPANLAAEGALTWKTKPVDSCIAPIVDALNKGGVFTASCCCGHGRQAPEIVLHDNRQLIISHSQHQQPCLTDRRFRRPTWPDCPQCGHTTAMHRESGVCQLCELVTS